MTQIHFRGFLSPNTTPIPDQLFDELLPVLGGAELKVLLYICRRTFGFKKESDNISLNQMLRGITRKDGTQLDAGVGLSKPTLLRSLKSLTAKRIVLTERRGSVKKGHEATNYRLNVRAAPLGKRMNLGEAQNFTKPLVKKFNLEQQTVSKKQLDNSVNGSQKTLLKALPDLLQEQGEVEHIAQSIVAQLGDTHSLAFYRLVARKIPAASIWRALSEIRHDGGADHAPRVFTYRMTQHATRRLQQAKKRIGSLTS
jgi:hypothetical protein